MFNTTEKRERALGTKLMLKPHRCSSPKCATVRKPQPPGPHGGARRRAGSEYGLQLKEKQKMKAMYGIREAAMRKVFAAAEKSTGATGEAMLMLLERRLDNVVYRLGFAPSRSVARQLVSHGHIMMNGRRVSTPSALVVTGGVITIRPQSRDNVELNDIGERMKSYEAPVWLALDKSTMTGKVVSAPKDLETLFDTNLVVDYYSK